MTMHPEGAKRLDAWCEAQGRGAAADLARTLGVSAALISHWRAGRVRPDSELKRRALEAATNGAVPASSWLDDGERAERDRLQAIVDEAERRGQAKPGPEAA